MGSVSPMQLKVGVGIAIAFAIGALWMHRDTVDEDWIVHDASRAIGQWCLQASPISYAVEGIDYDDYVWQRDDWIAILRGEAGPFSMTIEDHADQVDNTLRDLTVEASGDSGLTAVLWDLQMSMSDALSAVYRTWDAETPDNYIGGVARIAAECRRMQGVLHGMLLGRK